VYSISDPSQSSPVSRAQSSSSNRLGMASEHNHSKIFVGNLPFKCTNEDLEALFGRYGPIIGVSIRKDRKTNKPKGFAFVSFASPESGPEAIRSMQGHVFGGRALTVNAADKRGGKDDGDGEGDGVEGDDSRVDSIALAEASGGGGAVVGSRRKKEEASWKTVPDPPRPSVPGSGAGAGAKEAKIDKSKSWTSWAGPK